MKGKKSCVDKVRERVGDVSHSEPETESSSGRCRRKCADLSLSLVIQLPSNVQHMEMKCRSRQRSLFLIICKNILIVSQNCRFI